MGYRKWIIVLNIFFLALVCVNCGARRVLSLLFPHGTYVWDISEDFSANAQQAIKDAIIKQEAQVALSVPTIFSVRSLAHIDMRRKVCGAVVVRAISHEPYALLSLDQVLTRAGTVCLKDEFAQSAFHSVPTILVKQNFVNGRESEQADLISWALNTDLSIAQRYTIVWTDKHTIWLHKRGDLSFSIKASTETVLNQKLLDLCERLKEDIGKRRLFLKNPRNLILDVRFNEQIVCYKREGEGDGSSII